MARDPFPFDVGQPKKPRRNLLITLVMMLLIINDGAKVVLLVVVPLFTGSVPADLPTAPEPWVGPVDGVLSLVYVVGVLGVWWWRRWGVTLMWIGAVLTAGTGLLFPAASEMMLSGSLIMFLGAIAATIWARVKRVHFD